MTLAHPKPTKRGAHKGAHAEAALARAYYAKVARLPCAVCGAFGVQVHHKTGAGVGRRSDWWETMPLCEKHHTGGNFGECVHNGTMTFEARYGTQDEMIADTRRKLMPT